MGDLNFIYSDEKMIKDIVETLEPIEIAVEMLSRRDATLMTSEGVILFLLNKMEGFIKTRNVFLP